MKFYKELNELKEINSQCLAEISNLEEQEKSELTKIRDKYSKLKKTKYQEISEHNKSIDSYHQILETYSFFNAEDIGNIIASLIRIFEGIDYVYKDTYYYQKEVQFAFGSREEIPTRDELKIIIAEEDEMNLFYDYYEYHVNSLIESDKAIVLSNTKAKDNQIQFYVANTITHSLEPRIKFGKFTYVKDFIDELISYKIEKKSKTISSEELENIETDFVTSRLAQIENNYHIVEEQQEKQIKQKLDEEKNNRQLRLRKILDKRKKLRIYS